MQACGVTEIMMLTSPTRAPSGAASTAAAAKNMESMDMESNMESNMESSPRRKMKKNRGKGSKGVKKKEKRENRVKSSNSHSRGRYLLYNEETAYHNGGQAGISCKLAQPITRDVWAHMVREVKKQKESTGARRVTRCDCDPTFMKGSSRGYVRIEGRATAICMVPVCQQLRS